MPGQRGLSGTLHRVSGLLIGYARVSTADQDLTAQRDGLAALGVDPERVYVDHGLTGTNRARPGLREALAACRDGDTLVVTKLDRLARSVPDARDIVDELTARGVRLNIGGSVHDPTDPIGRLLFTVLSMIAEFEADLARARTREGHGRRQGQGPAPRQAAQAQAGPGERTWSSCGATATTPPPSWPTCSTSAAPPCTARSSAEAGSRRPKGRERGVIDAEPRRRQPRPVLTPTLAAGAA